MVLRINSTRLSTRLAAPPFEKVLIDQRRGVFTAEQRLAVAARALGIVSGLPTAGLLFGVDAIPHRT